MLLSTQTEFFTKSFGYEQGIEKLCKIGYDRLDLTLTHLGTSDNDVLLSDNYLETALKMRNIANKYGVSFNQSHAPYRFKNNDLIGNASDRANAILKIKRAIEIAGAVGAEVIVVHPLHKRNFNSNSPDFFFNVNMEFYSLIAETAIKNGVKIALENMWQRNIYTNGIIADVCSNPYEFARYLDALNEKYSCFVACLDIGHCALTGVDPCDAVKILGSRLRALHVHDNNTLSDMHMLPFTGTVDFIALMQALKESNYTGALTFEADKFLKRFPVDCAEQTAKFMEQIGRKLVELAN